VAGAIRDKQFMWRGGLINMPSIFHLLKYDDLQGGLYKFHVKIIQDFSGKGSVFSKKTLTGKSSLNC